MIRAPVWGGEENLVLKKRFIGLFIKIILFLPVFFYFLVMHAIYILNVVCLFRLSNVFEHLLYVGKKSHDHLRLLLVRDHMT